MKKPQLLILAIALLLTGSLMAQRDNDRDKPSLLTITAGWGYADLEQGDESTDTRNGIFLGVRKAVRIVPMVHLETGLLYVQKGATLKYQNIPNQEFKLN